MKPIAASKMPAASKAGLPSKVAPAKASTASKVSADLKAVPASKASTASKSSTAKKSSTASKSSTAKKTSTASKAKASAAEKSTGKGKALSRPALETVAAKKTTPVKVGKPGVTDTFGVVKGKLDKLTASLASLPESQRQALTSFYAGDHSAKLPSTLAGPHREVESTLKDIGQTLSGLDDAGRSSVFSLLGIKDVSQLAASVLSSLGSSPPGTGHIGQSVMDRLFGIDPTVQDTASAFSSGPSFAEMKADLMGKGLKDEDASMTALQEQQQRYNRMLTLLTQLLQMKHEGLKGIVQNIR